MSEKVLGLTPLRHCPFWLQSQKGVDPSCLQRTECSSLVWPRPECLCSFLTSHFREQDCMGLSLPVSNYLEFFCCDGFPDHTLAWHSGCCAFHTALPPNLRVGGPLPHLFITGAAKLEEDIWIVYSSPRLPAPLPGEARAEAVACRRERGHNQVFSISPPSVVLCFYDLPFELFLWLISST